MKIIILILGLFLMFAGCSQIVQPVIIVKAYYDSQSGQTTYELRGLPFNIYYYSKEKYNAGDTLKFIIGAK